MFIRSTTIIMTIKPQLSANNPILKALGLTDKQAAILMPQGLDAPALFVGVVVTPEDDSQTWAEREYEKDHRGLQSMGRIDKP